MNDLNSRQLALADVPQAAEVLAQAFIDDPLCAFMLPDRRSRINTLRKFFRAYGQININLQRGYGVGDPLKGVAYWMPPNQAELSINIKALKGFIPLLFTFYPLGYFKAREVIKETDRLHQKYARQPHYYLDNLGVLPAEQGKGFSSMLIRPFLDKANQEKVSLYTDTVTEKNVKYYEHFGFECIEECPVLDTGITIWSLLRQAQ
jgi:ribosomal protein S18 acetylase RimI-like enzyme